MGAKRHKSLVDNYRYLLCLTNFDCLFDFIQYTSKRLNQLGQNKFEATHMTPMKVYGCSEFQKFDSKKIDLKSFEKI